MHYLMIDNSEGELIDAFPVCSDSCHRQYCEVNGLDYGGWCGAMEIEMTTTCENCGDLIEGNDIAELLEEANQ